MKFGMFGGAILLLLTILFSYMAIQNNKIAKEVVVQEFELDKKQIPTTLNDQAVVANQNPVKKQTVSQKPKAELAEADQTVNKWDEFNKKFENFDKKFEGF